MVNLCILLYINRNIPRPIIPPEAHSSRMFEDFPSDLMKALSQEPLTGNFHHYGVTIKVCSYINQCIFHFFMCVCVLL